MRELIAVNNFFTALNIQMLKREALMFDRLAIPQISQLMQFFQGLLGEMPPEAAEYDWLCEQGILFEVTHDKKAEIQDEEYKHVDEYSKALMNEVESMYKEHDLGEFTELKKDQLVESASRLKESLSSKVPNLQKLVTSETFQRSLILGYDYFARGISIQLRELKGLDAYPILLLDIPSPERKTSSTHDIVDITLNALPIPDDNTPWEQIIDFRNDSEAKGKFVALKQWANKVARMQLEAHEVKDQLESLINDYQEHMKVHKIKTRLDTLRTIIVAEAGFITSGWLAGLGAVPGLVGMVVSPLYSIRQRQVALLEAELKAPGREVAYIVKAREEFAK